MLLLEFSFTNLILLLSFTTSMIFLFVILLGMVVKEKLTSFLEFFASWVFLLRKKKWEGPYQRLVFLDIEIDSVDMIVCLLSDKFSSLFAYVGLWYKSRKCTKRELLLLIGSLSFACMVIKSGHIFLRCLISLPTKVSKLNHRLDISLSVRSDLLMWFDLLKSRNEVSVF